MDSYPGEISNELENKMAPAKPVLVNQVNVIKEENNENEENEKLPRLVFLDWREK